MTVWKKFRLPSLLISGLCAAALLLGSTVTSTANQQRRSGGGGGGTATAIGIGIGVGLILNATKNASDAEKNKQERINRRVDKRKALDDDKDKKREKAVSKIREAKEAKKARAARPASKKPLDDQMIDDFNEDMAQLERAAEARKALEEYRQAVAKAQWWQAEAAQAGDVPDMNAEIFRRAQAEAVARKAKQIEDFEKIKEEDARKAEARQLSDAQVSAKAASHKQWLEDRADATNLDKIRDEKKTETFGSTTSAESVQAQEKANKKAAEAEDKRKQEQATKLGEIAKQKPGTLAGDLAGTVSNTNLKQDAIDANK